MKKLISIIFFIPGIVLGADLSSLKEIARKWDSQPHYSKTKATYIKEDADFEDQIPLTLVILKGSGWTSKEVLSKLKRTQEIFAQCKISLFPVLLIKTKNANGHVVNYDYHDFPDTVLADYELENTPALSKPVVYFLSKEEDNRYGAGVSWPPIHPWGKADPQIRNSVLLYRSKALRAKNNTSLSETKPGFYEVLAHELAHILFDEPHLKSEGHIMSTPTKVRTNNIKPYQCQRARDFFL